MKKNILLMLIVINIAGCNGMPQPSTSTDYVQAQGKVIVEKKDYTMRIGDFEWKEGNFEARKISETNIYDLADRFNTVEVEKGDKIKIEIEQNPSSIIVEQWNEDGTIVAVELIGNEITLPSKEGYYIYEVIVEWNEGKINYVFDINIK
ncbi:hypothetical protein [Psychrobacillus sp. FJAT-21963]|uniref:hypothetical protein n=1 Tax=Psychrobacillus sp. FJAT-21963 TaxID=1712028 RepID=UPI0006F88F88|nr:hypothetical protein [Psychrobacillus sp. FJAT-21963]KQL34398.1 hypothetical protein AN959_15485 [Psychrobacillus sp. FJAT-21963]